MWGKEAERNLVGTSYSYTYHPCCCLWFLRFWVCCKFTFTRFCFWQFYENLEVPLSVCEFCRLDIRLLLKMESWMISISAWLRFELWITTFVLVCHVFNIEHLMPFLLASFCAVFDFWINTDDWSNDWGYHKW